MDRLEQVGMGGSVFLTFNYDDERDDSNDELGSDVCNEQW